MSVLNFPRVYFGGCMAWNPPTANNNDVFPFYDGVNVDLNWAFLKTQGIDKRSPTLKQDIHQWLVTEISAKEVPSYVTDVPGNAGNFPFTPAEWDLFGDNACYSVNYPPQTGANASSTVIGGETKYNDYLSTTADDALIGSQFQILGNPFGGTDPTPGRFVDISPWQNTFTALYFDKLIFGDEKTGITLKRKYRMLDRFLNFSWGALGGLTYVTATWQSCFPTQSIDFSNEENSDLITALKSQLSEPGVKGLMVRFSTHLTIYDQNGVLNDFPKVVTHGGTPADKEKIKEMYELGLKNSSEIFFNPAYSTISGTLGLWKENEFPTSPGGRRLIASNPVTITPKFNGNDSIGLGVLNAEVVTSNEKTILSLDTLNTFPFKFSKDQATGLPIPEKLNVGAFALFSSGSRDRLVDFGYETYKQSEFDKRSGIIDFEISSEQAKQFNDNELELRTQKTVESDPLTAPKSASKEVPIIAESYGSGTFLNVGQTKTLEIQLLEKGKPLANTTLWVAQYGNPYSLGSSGYYLCFEPDSNLDFPITNRAGGEYFPKFKEASPVSMLGAVQRNDESQLFVSRISATSFTVIEPEQSTNRLSSQANSDQSIDVDLVKTYKEVIATPVGLKLNSALNLNASLTTNDTPSQSRPSTVTRTLENGKPVTYQVAEVTTNAQGIASVNVTGVEAGFPTLLFNLEGANDFPFSFKLGEAYVDFLTPVRVLPMNNNLITEFVAKWNEVYLESNANELIWNDFIYPKILEVFYYLYPIMDKYMPLDNLHRVEGAVDQLIVLISDEYRDESTLAMPITRDLPGSSREVLEFWAKELVKKNYPPRKLTVPAS